MRALGAWQVVLEHRRSTQRWFQVALLSQKAIEKAVVKHDKKPAPPPIQKMKNTIGKQKKRWQAGIGNCFIVYLNINSLGSIDNSLLACEEEGWELRSSKELCEDILATSRTFWDEQWTIPLRNGAPRVRVSSSQMQAYARTLRRQVIKFGTWMKSTELGWLSRNKHMQWTLNFVSQTRCYFNTQVLEGNCRSSN